MSKCGRRALSSARGQKGTTLVELLVVLAILSILAVTALPFAEHALQRQKEADLRQSLREVRTAIDAFHADWKDGLIGADNDGASENGYPVDFDVLVDGVKDTSPEGALLRYLRRVPDNPFAKGGDIADQWLLLGYADKPDAQEWNGEDLYDLRAITDRVALDGTRINEW